jgi:hypothetical protein
MRESIINNVLILNELKKVSYATKTVNGWHLLPRSGRNNLVQTVCGCNQG